MITEPTRADIDALRNAVKPYYTEKRYAHALSVEEEAARLGEILLPHRTGALRAAALLHDITKKYDFQKQLQYCADFGIILKEPVSPEVLHAKTGAGAAERDFPEFAHEDVINAIRYHTTGRWGMTVFEAVIFLSDYIEPSRTHEKCIALRNELYGKLRCADTAAEREKAFDRAVLCALDNTISYLMHKKAVIDIETVEARNYYLSQRNCI